MQAASGDDHHHWRFVTNHAHVLETIARDRTSRLRDIARAVGITERTAAQIVNDLVEAGYLTKIRDGRRNRYDVHEELPLGRRQHRHHTVGELLRFLGVPPQPHAPRKRRRRAIE
jgi:DNA-binding MarR family transcriptional regulator